MNYELWLRDSVLQDRNDYGLLRIGWSTLRQLRNLESAVPSDGDMDRRRKENLGKKFVGVVKSD
ncbi:MAG: hypothetical protein K2K75_11795 [Muribaculaceae bacterium]|nr:hypothetical protein [Muribaculaceae bacterium]